jgi:hypothetical protein
MRRCRIHTAEMSSAMISGLAFVLKLPELVSHPLPLYSTTISTMKWSYLITL